MNTSAVVRPGLQGRIAAMLGLLALLASVFVVSIATPARADGSYCGHAVLGAIEQRYIQMGGSGGSLGCPLTDELVNPDGVGRRTQFEHGTIYWSPNTGAWPVWGAIGDYWCSQGCEAGWAGYPTSYEYTVGAEVRQNFHCAVVHFQDLGGGASRTWGDNICV